MNLIALVLLLITLFVVNTIGRSFSVSLLHPIRLIVLFWTIMILTPIVFWQQMNDISGYSYFWLATFLLAMELGGIIVRGPTDIVKKIPCAVDDENNTYEPSNNWTILKAIVVLGFVSVGVTLATQGLQLSSIFSIQGILNTNALYSDLRSSGVNVRQTGMTMFLSLFVYLSAICGGYSYNCVRNGERANRLWCVFSAFPAVILTMMTSGKSGTIAAVMFWVCAWCVSRLSIFGFLPKIKWKSLIKIAAIAVLFMCFLYLTMLLRVGSFSKGTRLLILNKFYVYAFGQTYNFDIWFSQEAKLFGFEFGFNTYMAIPRFFGLASRTGGVYGITAGSIGNVFSAFRAVIEDYGIIGGLFYGFLKGILTQYVYIIVARKSPMNGYLSKSLLFAEYFWGLYSFIISPWIYTSYILMPLGLFVFLFLFNSHIRVRMKLHGR